MKGSGDAVPPGDASSRRRIATAGRHARAAASEGAALRDITLFLAAAAGGRGVGGRGQWADRRGRRGVGL